MNLKQAKTVTYILLFIGIIAAILIYFFGNRPGIMTPLLIVVILSCALNFIVQALFYRCPHCNRSLYGQRYIGDYCPHCGKYMY